MNNALRLLHLLADGDFHSGDELGKSLGVSRAGIWKMIGKLMSDYDLEIHKVKGRGYSIPGGVQFLNDKQIAQDNIEILNTIDSTNAYLMSRTKESLPLGFACFSEHQSSGRGRRGRKWFSPFGCNIFLSVLWRFKGDVTALQGLTLAMAVAVVRALTEYGLEGVEVKWPNDVYFRGKKLAGILVELQAVAHVETCVVVGVGLNVKMPDSAKDQVDQGYTDVASIAGQVPDRNRLASLLLNAIRNALSDFSQNGFASLKDEWATLDMLYGTEISLNYNDKLISGVAKGIDSEGSLLVDVSGTLQPFHSGEVSINKSR